MQSLKFYSVFILAVFFVVTPVSAKSGKEVNPRITVKQCFNTVLPNLLTGNRVPLTKEWRTNQLAKEKELDGLNYAAVVPWVPRKRDAVHRFFIEKFNFKNPNPMPVYDTAQQLGKQTVRLRDIRYSQANCRNMSQDKKYSVVANARSIKEGKLDIKVLPTIRVWRDTQGRIWTLDHRRLAAMHLSGAIDKLEVEFVSEALVKEQVFKFGTRNEGKTIFVYQDDADEKMSVVLMHKEE